MKTFTSKRLPNGHHMILRNGQPVGEAWRYPPRPHGFARRSAGARFGMRLDGFLWSCGEPVAHGSGPGVTTIATASLSDAVALAAKTLQAA